MTFQRGPAPAGNLRAEKPPFGLFAADQFHLTLFRLFSQPPLRRLGAAAMFASQFPCAARIFSRPALSLLPFLSGNCGLPPRPCSQARFPARHGFLPPGSFAFALSFRKLRLTAETVFASQFPCTARIFSHPALSLLPFLSGSCGLPPRPCSQARFPARHGFSPARLFHFCLFFPEVAARHRGHTRKPDSQTCAGSLPPGFSNFIPCGEFLQKLFPCRKPSFWPWLMRLLFVVYVQHFGVRTIPQHQKRIRLSAAGDRLPKLYFCLENGPFSVGLGR